MVLSNSDIVPTSVGIFCFYYASIYDIIMGMRKRIISILPVLSCLAVAPAMADWQYPGTYIGDGWYEDDGMRFTISARGGAAFGMGSIKNEVGAIVTGYYISPDESQVATSAYCQVTGNCDGWLYAGYGELADVPAAKDLESFSFAAGASIGWTIPNRPQWRIEAGWDHISESDYNSSPMFEGDLELQGGEISGVIATVESASVNSQVSTDIISVMAFYDFFDGLYKPTRTAIPYIGFGIGYADTKTILNLSDPFGDIAYQEELLQYGEIVETTDGARVARFYKSERRTSNVAGLLSLGVSYGISENMFMDFGARVAYLPKIKWGLSNSDDTRHREFFAAENVIYANIMLGLRFEF